MSVDGRELTDLPLGDGIEAKSLGEQIAESLARAIMTGEIAPGIRLSEEALAQRFGVSRTPVRDAFKILDQEHLVTILPRRGVRVIGFTAQDVVGIYTIRSRLHGLAVNLATLRLGPDDLTAMEALVDEMEAAAAADDQPRFLRANVAFHGIAEELADNSFLSRTLAGLGLLTLRLRDRGLGLPGRLEQSATAHRRVFQAMRAGDAAEADRLTRRLILDAGALILAADHPQDGWEEILRRVDQ